MVFSFAPQLVPAKYLGRPNRPAYETSQNFTHHVRRSVLETRDKQHQCRLFARCHLHGNICSQPTPTPHPLPTIWKRVYIICLCCYWHAARDGAELCFSAVDYICKYAQRNLHSVLSVWEMPQGTITQQNEDPLAPTLISENWQHATEWKTILGTVLSERTSQNFS